jgi:hypothetical protein
VDSPETERKHQCRAAENMVMKYRFHKHLGEASVSICQRQSFNAPPSSTKTLPTERKKDDEWGPLSKGDALSKIS